MARCSTATTASAAACSFNLDYAFTDRFSILSWCPVSGFEVHGPGAELFGLAVDDCFCWNHGWQDFGSTARYNVVNGAFALTPSISFGVPTHNYDYFGEAVLGRNLNELRIRLTWASASTNLGPAVAIWTLLLCVGRGGRRSAEQPE